PGSAPEHPDLERLPVIAEAPQSDPGGRAGADDECGQLCPVGGNGDVFGIGLGRLEELSHRAIPRRREPGAVGWPPKGRSPSTPRTAKFLRENGVIAPGKAWGRGMRWNDDNL